MDIKKQNTDIQRQFHARGFTGKDVTFCVIDSGCAPVVKNVMYASLNGPQDSLGHGTFVCSQIRDICPDSQIIAFNVFPDGLGGVSNVISALQEVYRLAKANPRKQYIVNMSLICGCTDSLKDLFEDAINTCVNNDVIVLCAAGNDGQEVLDKYPSCFEAPICISALNQDGSKAHFSTWHNEVDFAEWGVGCSGLDRIGFSTVMSGTSMACPNAAAKCGLLVDWYHQTFGHWPSEPETYDMLKSMVHDLGMQGRDPYYGWGLIVPQTKMKEVSVMFDYVVDLGLKWPRGRVKRTTTDHIQIHHTVGDYSSPERWKKLHEDRIEKDGYKGIEYSFGVTPDGVVYDGRGLEYAHGAVKDNLTNNANQRSVSITLIGDMREEHLPTQAQYAAALKLCKDVMEYYNLPVSSVLGHNEVPLAKGGTYATLCPSMDMEQFRRDLSGSEKPVVPDVEPPATLLVYPSFVEYTGSTYINVRSGPGSNYKVIGRFSAGERAIILDEQDDWDELILLDQTPIIRGWCKDTYTKEAT